MDPIVPIYTTIAQAAPPAGPGDGGGGGAGGGGAGAGQAQGQGGGFGMEVILLYAVMIAAIFMLFSRPGAKQRKELEKKLKGMKKGDKVVFSGIVGEVINPAPDEHTVTVRIAEGTDVTVQRVAITNVVDRSAGGGESSK